MSSGGARNAPLHSLIHTGLPHLGLSCAAVRNPTCPFAVQALLTGEESRRPIINPIATALHIAVTTASGDALKRYFDREDIKSDSTFYIDLLGGIWQFHPVNRKANAQNDGNSFVVSIETAGMSGPMNSAQIAAAVRLYAWLNTEWDISLGVSTRWDGPGAGWHSKYRQWNYNNHACPSDVRVKQLLELILPGAKTLVAGNRPPTSEEDDMPRKFIAGVPWDTGSAGSDPHFAVFEQENPQEVAVAAINGADFFPAWKDGQTTPNFTDFNFLGLQWRKFKTPGLPSGLVVNDARVGFTCDGTPGVYTLAVKQ